VAALFERATPVATILPDPGRGLPNHVQLCISAYQLLSKGNCERLDAGAWSTEPE
jgi:hypothetical protein